MVEREFPPPTITKWLQHETVNANALVAELRYWAIKMGGGDPTGEAESPDILTSIG